jgi:hypothetical protein
VSNWLLNEYTKEHACIRTTWLPWVGDIPAGTPCRVPSWQQAIELIMGQSLSTDTADFSTPFLQNSAEWRWFAQSPRWWWLSKLKAIETKCYHFCNLICLNILIVSNLCKLLSFKTIFHFVETLEFHCAQPCVILGES